MLRKGIFSLIFLFLLFSLMGCSDENTGGEPELGGEKTKDRRITISWPKDIGPLNPHLYSPSEMFAQDMLYESLVNYEEGGKITPNLAKRWDISEDAKVYTFYLREDVKYSDGTHFNSDNVVKNFNAIMANKDRHAWMGLFRFLDKVEKIDEYTFQLKLTEPYYPLLNELTFVRPLRFLGDNGFGPNDTTAEGISAPIGTGPWELAEYKKDEYAIFKVNKNYWGEKPEIDEVEIRIIPDPDSTVLAFENEELDMIYGQGIITLDSYEYLKENSKYHTSTSSPTATKILMFDTRTGPLRELNVRQAIHYGIDKEVLVESVTHGTEAVANTLFSDNMPYADIALPPLTYDLKKAEKLLDEAGWLLPKGKHVREKNGEQLTLDLTYIAEDAVQKPMAELIQGELAKIGIRVNIEGVDVMVGLQMFKEGKVDMNFTITNGAPNDPHNFLNELSIPAASGHYEAQLGLPNKKEIDTKIQNVLVTSSEGERATLYKDILTMLHEQAAFYPISYERNLAIYHDHIQNVTHNSTKYHFPFNTLEVKE